jgi:hypothetical protein
MRRVLSLSAVLLLLWVGLCLAATEVICIVDTDATQNPDYTSLAAAIAGETGASPKCVTSADLVANDEQLTIECRASSGAADTTPVTISGFTTSADCYVKIYVPPEHRHNGKYDDQKYRIEANASYVGIIDPAIAYLKINGLQGRNTYSGSGTGYFISKVTARPAGFLIIENCLSSPGFSTSRGGININEVSANDYISIKNTIIYGCTGIYCSGIHVRGGPSKVVYDLEIYNCVAHGSLERRYAVEVERIDTGGSVSIKNVVATGASTADFYLLDVSGTEAYSNNASSDSTALGDDSLINQIEADLFSDPSAGDFSLVSNSPLIDAGIGPALDSNVPTTDIVGNPRSGNTCSIGAFEYVVSGGNGSKWNGITPAKWNGVDWSNLKWNGM